MLMPAFADSQFAAAAYCSCSRSKAAAAAATLAEQADGADLLWVGASVLS
jgi:hypothetical protein